MAYILGYYISFINRSSSFKPQKELIHYSNLLKLVIFSR